MNEPIEKTTETSRFVSEGNPNTDKIVETVRSLTPEDQKMIGDVQEAIRKEHSIADGSRHIQVTAHASIVTLNGNVLSEKDKMTIGDKAAAVAGFGHVKNELKVVESP